MHHESWLSSYIIHCYHGCKWLTSAAFGIHLVMLCDVPMLIFGQCVQASSSYNKLITQNRENWQKAFHILDLISAVRLQRTIVSSVAFLFKGSKRLDLLWAMLRSVRLGKLSWIFTNVWRWHVVLGFVLSGTSWERWFLVSNGMNQSYLALVWILNLFWCLIRQLDSTDEWSLKRSLQRVKR